MKRVNLYLDAALWTAFRMACLAHHTSASQAIVALIREQLRRWHTAPPATATDDAPQR